jgi:quercetin dioxygenase-like cupin family protein
MQYNLNHKNYVELRPGFFVKMIHTATNTIAFFKISEGAELPTHSHVHTQTTTVLSGELALTLNGESSILKANQVVHILSNEPHSVKALTNCEVIDVFYPVREDYSHL